MSHSHTSSDRYVAELHGGPFDGQAHEVDGADGSPADTLALPQPDTEVTADYVLEAVLEPRHDGSPRASYRWLEDTFR